MRWISRLRAVRMVVTAAALVSATSFAFAQVAVPRPRINTNQPPTTVSPSLPTTMCVPDKPDTPCTPPILPTPTPMPVPLPVPKPLAPTVATTPRAALADAPTRGGAAIGEDKVLSYFQRGTTRVDTRKAFGFVLLPKSAVSAQEKQSQIRFCRILLASLDFADADAAAQSDALVTYWPLVAAPSPAEIAAAFTTQDCARLIVWYDHTLARSIAARADLAGLGGPFLITWPSQGPGAAGARDPLIVDFAVANHARATKALAYWFGELRQKPELWTSRIREGTIRAELADAINDTAGVVVAVLAGKWESVTAVGNMP
jgi:hypothetical protein